MAYEVRERLTTDPATCQLVAGFLQVDAGRRIVAVDVTRTATYGKFSLHGAMWSLTARLHPITLLDMIRAQDEGASLSYRLDYDDAPLTSPKEPAVAADIEKKVFTHQRVEWHVATPGGFEGGGALWTDLMQAITLATHRLVELGKVKHGDEPASDLIKIRPSDDHVIVFIEFDEEQK